MGYVTESKRKLYLLFGFIGMFMCGIGDILFAFRGDGEPFSVCSVVIMCLRAAVCSGLSAESINEYFMGTVLFPFIVTTIWQTLADLLVAIAYIGFICKKVINISKAWIACGPICLYLIFGIIRTILEQFTANPLYDKLLAGGEPWGLAFMFLAVFFCIKDELFRRVKE